MIPEYVQKIRSKTGQSRRLGMKMFLGFAVYYRTFTPQYSVLTNWLNGIKKGEKFLWNKEIEKDFMELKKAVTDSGIQAFPDFGVGDPFILTTDWSKENIAGVLSHVQNGQESFLGCWGRKCDLYVRNYSSYKGELLAVI